MSNNIPSKRWLTLPDLAEYLSCSKSKIYHSVAQGSIPFSKRLGSLRFDREKIDAWMEDGAFESDLAEGRICHIEAGQRQVSESPEILEEPSQHVGFAGLQSPRPAAHFRDRTGAQQRQPNGSERVGSVEQPRYGAAICPRLEGSPDADHPSARQQVCSVPPKTFPNEKRPENMLTVTH